MQVGINRCNAININRYNTVNRYNAIQLCKATNKACEFGQLVW